MKTRQLKLTFPKVNDVIKKTKSKSATDSNITYESEFSGTFDDKKTIPKLVIRKKNALKKKIIKLDLDVNNNTDEKDEISFSQLLKKVEVDELVPDVIIKTDLSTIQEDNIIIDKELKSEICTNGVSFSEFLKDISEMSSLKDTNSQTKEVSQHSLNNEIISSNLSQLTVHCNEINCFGIYYDFLSKIPFNPNKCWNEMFSPKSIDHFITSNFNEVFKFKRWLNDWKKNVENVYQTKNSPQSDDSDFEFIPKNNKTFCKKPASVCVILGPSGVGKTSMVYAIAKELSYQVLEMNCSSRRTGKDVLDTLINATSNQHVAIQNGLEPAGNKRKSTNKLIEPPNKQMKLQFNLKRSDSKLTVTNDSILLFDDADIVMEEDRGFWGAICTLIETKNRPVVLTCTDPSEATKFIKKLTKATHLTINLDKTIPQTIVSYLQTVLLSQNQIPNNSVMLDWSKTLTNGPLNLRSAINNLQFDSVVEGLNYRARPTFDDWTRFKVAQLSSDETNDTVEGDSAQNLVANRKRHCKRSLQALSFMTDTLSRIDAYVNKSMTTFTRVCHKYANIDRHVESLYDPQQYIAEEINETLIALHNSHQRHTLTQLTNDATQLPQNARDQHNMAHHHSTQTQILSKNVRSTLMSHSNRCDRISTLRIMAASENVRKSSFTSRRFTHYFDRINSGISASHQNYLSTPFTK